MPTYKIIITDADVPKVHEDIERNLQAMKAANDKLKYDRMMKHLNSLSKRIGMVIGFTVEWIWLDESHLKLTLDSTAPLKDEVFDGTAKKLADWGNLRILGEKGKVILNG